MSCVSKMRELTYLNLFNLPFTCFLSYSPPVNEAAGINCKCHPLSCKNILNSHSHHVILSAQSHIHIVSTHTHKIHNNLLGVRTRIQG